MNKTQGYIVATLIVCTLVYFMYGPSGTMGRNQSSNRNAESLPEADPLKMINKKSTTSVNIETNKDTSIDKQKKLEARLQKLQMPSVNIARQEVAKNPHVTPKTLIQNAYTMSQLFDEVQDEKSAKLFLDKMRECSIDSADTPVAVKSSCIRYLDRLEKKFPHLKTDIEHVREQASQEARELEQLSR
jgi:hypothetical protein